MPTIPQAGAPLPEREPHRARQVAESFGSNAERYDRTRPHYPEALVHRIVAGSPGSDVLDVGVGTGIEARQFQAAGCRVLGVEPDARMADFARRSGVEVEEATFEAWDPAGRNFDAVVAGQAWHWVDPAAGAAKAADGIRQAGAFGDAEQWRFDWEQSYTRDEWLDQLPTFGLHTRLPPAKLQEVLGGIGAAVDAAGGGFTMRYATVVVTAARTGAA
jgi:SAM-dependent methyltransferase